MNSTVTGCEWEDVLFSRIRPILFTGERYRIEFHEYPDWLDFFGLQIRSRGRVGNRPKIVLSLSTTFKVYKTMKKIEEEFPFLFLTDKRKTWKRDKKLKEKLIVQVKYSQSKAHQEQWEVDKLYSERIFLYFWLKRLWFIPYW